MEYVLLNMGSMQKPHLWGRTQGSKDTLIPCIMCVCVGGVEG